jgi:hypothetical protein
MSRIVIVVNLFYIPCFVRSNIVINCKENEKVQNFNFFGPLRLTAVSKNLKRHYLHLNICLEQYGKC